MGRCFDTQDVMEEPVKRTRNERIAAKIAVCLWALTICLWGGVQAAQAQTGATGRLEGTVMDQNGAAVVGASVVATQAATGTRRETQSDESGRYSLPVLPVGEYTLTVESQGFQQYVRSGIHVEAAVSSTIQVSLRVGAVTQQITVSEAAPVINTTQSTTFRQINQLEMVEVPSSTRSFTHLLTAEAGVATDLPPVQGNDTGAQSPSVNGLRTTSNSLQFNGIDATNLLSNEGSLTENISPAPETIQEVKLQTSLYDASTGRNGGGNFQIVTKGGTNDWHGTGTFFFQNDSLNANDFFYNRDGIERPESKRYEGGFTLGGPLVRDKVLLFGGYQRTTAKTGFVSTASATSDLPLFLDYITDRSSPAAFSSNVLAAMNAARAACGFAPIGSIEQFGVSGVSTVGANLFSLRNPVTGDFIIPAPNAASGFCDLDEDGNPLVDNASSQNPITRVRQVVPSEFDQDQFTFRSDINVSDNNRLYGVFFFSNFPSLDSFPDPSSLSSPFTLRRNNRARTLSIGDTHVFGSALVNEARFGLLDLNNTRTLDDPFLTDAMSSAAVGVTNPALEFDDSPATRRLGHYTFSGGDALARVSFGGPNDSFNRRQQRTYSLSDTVSWTRGAHSFRFGAEYRHHNVRNNLPEEQGTEFEKIASYTALIVGITKEADTQYGITEKEFNSHDLSWFLADDWKLTRNFTLNLGLRWDWFGWPIEANGLLGNFDPTTADTETLAGGFIVPSNVGATGIPNIDTAVQTVVRANNSHTLNGQDLNNFQPRIGFAWQPFGLQRTVIRGGYGIFFDRPSAAFINTVFSNYPFLREIEVTFPSNAVPIATAYSQQDTTLPFNAWLPMRPVYRSSKYEIRDGTGITLGADGTVNPSCEANASSLSNGGPCLGNIAETFEFRAIDRDLRTPYVQQWNFGIQQELTNNMALEIRYAGTKGTKLLGAVGLAEPYDLNDPNTPDYIFARLNQAYANASAANAASLGTGSIPASVPANPCPGNQPSCLAGVGRAFGFRWANDPALGVLQNQFDLNAANSGGSDVVSLDVRVPYMGINTPEAIILKNVGKSIYHALQTNFTKRFSHGVQFNLSYTLSHAIDDNSADPGSTAGGGKPDVPNTGFIVQGTSRDLAANRGSSDFDRRHRFSTSFVWDIPTGGMTNALVSGWQLAGFIQAQSGNPYSIFSAEPEAKTAADLLSVRKSAGGLYRLGFGRPSLDSGATVDSLTDTTDKTVAFTTDGLVSSFGQNGNMGRNVLRAGSQKRFDMAIAKKTNITERYVVEFRTEIFNIFNNVNFALPVNDLGDSSVGEIEQTIGGPRVVQFGFKFVF
jgi:hypothetical protein